MNEGQISGDHPDHHIPSDIAAASHLVHETPSTRIYYLADEDNSFGGRTGAVAIKSLANQRPHPERVRLLYNEYVISRKELVSECSAVRAALRYTGHNGLHAIYLEWAVGVTLREHTHYIQKQASRSETSIDSRDVLRGLVRLALDISGAISIIHNAGVVHNAICADNIILDEQNRAKKHEKSSNERVVGTELTFNVKIIDLASAALYKQNDAAASVSAKKRDLSALGAVLHELFRANGSLAKKKTNSTKGSSSSTPWSSCEDGMGALSIGIPYSIALLVSRLRGDGRTDQSYRSAKEVQHDLEQILEDPERLLYRTDPNTLIGDLPCPHDKLYGRDAEISMLLDAYSRSRSLGGKSETVLVSGISGSGKSSLIRHVQESLNKNGVKYLCGKFDQLCQVEPLSAIIDSFAAYCKNVLDSGQDTIDQTGKRIYQEVGNEGISVLVDLIPGLREVIGAWTATTATRVGVLHTRERVKHVLHLLLGALAGGSDPLVFFLDDLQWANIFSLDVLHTLITSNRRTPVLFVGCYRDNEVTSSHPLSVQLHEIERLDVPIYRIKLNRIERNAMNDLIADTLFAPRSMTTVLTDIVYDKTNGNAFFAIQLLKSLCDKEGGLRFSWTSGMWQWDMEEIKSKLVADTAAELITKKLLQLPEEIRGALAVAACLGSHCDETCLTLISDTGFVESETRVESDAGCCLVQRLTLAVGKGLINKMGSSFEFAHDQIQLAAYLLIPERERLAMHHMIGKRIWKRSSPLQLEGLLFVAVDQLLLGSAFDEKRDDVDIAMLYLRAGRKAMISSFFSTAAAYLKAGIESLGQGLWDNHYDLSLQLHNACAECELTLGDFDEMSTILDSIFSHARCFEDQIIAYSTKLTSVFASEQTQEALRIGFLVLERLGESFRMPENISEQIKVDHAWTLNMLEGFTDETLVAMKAMRDSQKIIAMEFLHSLIMKAYTTCPQYFPVFTFRAVQLSLLYGVCKESAFAFASYGAVLCISFGTVEDIERGCRFGRLSLQLVERFGNMECLAALYAVLYGCVNFWNEHIALGIEPLRRGRQIGMMFGDVESSMSDAYLYSVCSFHSGRDVAILEEEVGQFCKEMIKFKPTLTPVIIIRQTLQNLMGQSEDPLRLTGECMTEHNAMKDFLKHSRTYAISFVYRHRMWLACYFGDFTLAAEMAGKLRQMDNIDSAPWTCNEVFYDGLASVIQAQRTRDSKWKILAKKAMKKLEDWAVGAPCNVQHKVLLLQAEFDVLEENYIKAGLSYEAAIAMAAENGFVHEKALACERAASLRLERGDTSSAAGYFHRAHDLYSEWGAIAKAYHLRDHSLALLISS